MGASDEPGADEPIDGVPAVALVAAGDLDPEGPVGCLLQQSAEGHDAETARAKCGFIDFASPAIPGMHTMLPLGLSVAGNAYFGTVTCGSNVDSRIAGGHGGHYTYGQGGYYDRNEAPGRDAAREGDARYRDLADKADQKWKEYVDAIEEGARNHTFGDDPEKDAELDRNWKRKEFEANDAIKERDAEGPPLVADGGGGGDAGTARPSGEDACAEAMALVAQCNAINWMAPNCQEVLAKMRNCDASIITPHPDDNEPCAKSEEPNLETVKKIQTLVCSMRIKPAPDQDPCAGATVEAHQFRGYVPTQKGGPACGSEIALTTPDACQPTITVLSPEQQWLNSVAEKSKRVGNRVFIIPLPEPFPNDPNDPRTCHPHC